MTFVDGRLRFCSDGSGNSNYGKRIDLDDDYIPFPLRVPDPIESAMQPALPVPLGVPVVSPVSDDSHGNESLNSLTFLPANPVQSAPPVPRAFPVIAPGSAASRQTAADIIVIHCVHGHADGFYWEEQQNRRCRVIRKIESVHWMLDGKGVPKTDRKQHEIACFTIARRGFVDLSGPDRTS